MKSGQLYVVRTVYFQDGERFPVLICLETGFPLWYPNLFITTQVRNNDRSSSTMASALEAIKQLLYWAESCSPPIDIEKRFSNSELLSTTEMDSLKAYVQRKKPTPLKEDPSGNVQALSKKLEKARMGRKKKQESVAGSTQYIRMTYIAEYIDWLAKRVIEDRSKRVGTEQIQKIKEMTTAFRKRRPIPKGRNQEHKRMGLTKVQQAELIDVTKAGSANNPFKSNDIQIRNELIVKLLYFLGIRVGEMLNLRIRDFDFQANTILIARRPDDSDDPRVHQPRVKTNDRLLPSTDALMGSVLRYITETRCLFPAAKKHDFLLVTHKQGPTCGQPLSLKAVTKIFKEIRAESNILPEDLSPHLLRHTSNDRFTDIADESSMKPEDEEKSRSYIYGWKEGSGSAKTYTRRHTRNKGREASLKLQTQLERGEVGK